MRNKYMSNELSRETLGSYLKDDFRNKGYVKV